jgi:hypothetical protein
MPDSSWRLAGEYFETCNCDYLCPCPESASQAVPTKGECIAAMAFRVKEGNLGPVSLGGLNFVVVLRTPGPMAKGGWTVGMIADERADAAQRQALDAILAGKLGGPPARFTLVAADHKGVTYRPIRFEGSGMSFSVSVPDALDQAVNGVPGGKRPNEPIYLDNLGHPANSRLALARASRSHIHAFGIDWDNAAGGNNGHFAPFEWQGP